MKRKIKLPDLIYSLTTLMRHRELSLFEKDLNTVFCNKTKTTSKT